VWEFSVREKAKNSGRLKLVFGNKRLREKSVEGIVWKFA